MERPEESKYSPRIQLHWGVFLIPLVCVLVTFFTYAKFFWMVRTRI